MSAGCAQRLVVLSRGCRLRVQLRLASSTRLLPKGIQHVFCDEEVQTAMLAKSTLMPGLSTIIAQLIQTSDAAVIHSAVSAVRTAFLHILSRGLTSTL